MSGGGQIYAEPLYVSNLAIPGQGTHNVVFVATENNDVYAFDADSNAGANGGLLWHVNLGPYALTPPPNNVFGGRYGPYSDIKPQVGITSTPVIDLASGTRYVDSFTNDGAASTRITSGHSTSRQGRKSHARTAAVQASHRQSARVNSRQAKFAAAGAHFTKWHLYVAYRICRHGPYHAGSWLQRLDLVTKCSTPPNHPNPADQNSEEGGIWQSEWLLVGRTTLYVMTGNGDFN